MHYCTVLLLASWNGYMLSIEVHALWIEFLQQGNCSVKIIIRVVTAFPKNPDYLKLKTDAGHAKMWSITGPNAGHTPWISPKLQKLVNPLTQIFHSYINNACISTHIIFVLKTLWNARCTAFCNVVHEWSKSKSVLRGCPEWCRFGPC